MASWEIVTANPLIDPTELSELLRRVPAPTVLDVRWRLGGPPCRSEHAAGHIPGAVFLDLDADVCGPPGARGRHPLPDPRHLQAVLRRAVVRDGGAVAVYDGGDGMAASRTWWTLRWAGLSDVRVLDGGYPAWAEAGLPVETGSTEPDLSEESVGDVVVRPRSMPVVDADGAAKLARAGRLIDVRAAARYRGEQEPIDPVAGHIPGALNAPDGEIGPDGRFAPIQELRERYAALGAEPGVPTGAYCGSGVAAARAALAMTAAGFEPVLYVGSWSEWITDPRRPVATGDQR